MDYPNFPVPFGVIYAVEKPTYEAQLMEQVHTAQQKSPMDLRALYHNDYTWTVEADDEPIRTTDTSEMIAVAGMDEAYIDDMQQSMTDEIKAAQSDMHEGLAKDPIANLHHGRPLMTLAPDTSLHEAIKIMQESNIGALLVVDMDRKPVGIFTERDVLFKIATQVENLEAYTVADFMTPDPDTLRADMPIAHALHLMSIHRYRHVPNVDDQGRAISIISFRDVVSYIEKYFDT